MIEKIDLNAIMKDRINVITLSRKVNEIIDYIDILSKKIDMVNVNIASQNIESVGNTVVENEIKEIENSELINNQQDDKKEVKWNSVYDDEDIKNTINERIITPLNEGLKKINKNGNRVIRKKWSTTDKALK